MNIFRNIWKEWKTTIAGVLLITFALLDLWMFQSMTAVVLGMKVQTIGILIGLGLVIAPDWLVGFAKKKLDE